MHKFEESGSVQTYGHLCVLIQLKIFIFWKWRWSNAYGKQRTYDNKRLFCGQNWFGLIWIWMTLLSTRHAIQPKRNDNFIVIKVQRQTFFTKRWC